MNSSTRKYVPSIRRRAHAANRPLQCLFAADLHGNQDQFSAVFQHALDARTELLIFGGDITPKSEEERTVDRQARFLFDYLVPSIGRFKERASSRGQNCRVVLLFGNDDFAANAEGASIGHRTGKFDFLTNGIIDLNDDYQLVGYSYVPFTPFVYKDWEKPDLSFSRPRPQARYDGLVSDARGMKRITSRELRARPSIESDLAKLFARVTKKVIFVSHAPPMGTNLDVVRSGAHVGSEAIREAIDRYQPLVSLHGHIHETVEMSGNFTHVLGSTVALSPGNFFNRSETAAIDFNTASLAAANLIKLRRRQSAKSNDELALL